MTDATTTSTTPDTTTPPVASPEGGSKPEPSPTPDKKPEPYNELHALADFIKDRRHSELDQSVWAHLMIVADGHEPYSADCRWGHQYDDFPCDEFFNAISLGIGWLKTRIETNEQQR